MRTILFILAAVAIVNASPSIDIPNTQVDSLAEHTTKAATLLYHSVKETKVNGTSLAQHTNNVWTATKDKTCSLTNKALDKAKETTIDILDTMRTKLTN